MHVALIHRRVGGRSSGGGGSRLMLDLGMELHARGHRVTVVCHEFDPGTEFRDASRVLDVRAVRRGPFTVPSGKRVALRQFWLEMPKVAALVPSDADVINAHEWPAPRAASLAARRLSVPFVWTRNDHTIFERALLPGRRNESTPRLIGRIPRVLGSFPDFVEARRAAAIVTNDEESGRMVWAAYRRRAVIIRGGVDPSFFDPPDREAARARLGVGADAFLALGVGIMNLHRRFEDLVAALAMVEDPRLQALIVGSDHVNPAYADLVERLVAERGVSDRVRLARRGVSEPELRDAYAAADVFVFPNDHRQSWGLAPLEALAGGTPVILSRAAGVSEVLAGRAGVLSVPARCPGAIADALRRLLARPEVEGMTETREWLRRELTPARYAERMEGVFARAVEAQGAARART